MILGGLALRVLGAMVATFWALDGQKTDGVVVALTGKQRLLIQRMTTEAFGVQQERQGAQTAASTSSARSDHT